MNNQPIGILDSGVGGLSIWKEIVKEVPHESTIYIADSLNCPYGERSEEEIYDLSKRLIQFLIEQKVKLIVVACNTITVACIDKLRQYLLRRHSGEQSDSRISRIGFWTSQNDKNSVIPIVGTVPAIKTAAKESKNKKIGILSTFTTAQSRYQKNLIDKFAKDCEIVSISASELVPYVEKGEVEGEETKKVLKKTLNKFLREGVDTIALGCSHFPFLKEEIGKIMGDKVKVFDSGAAIARQVRRVLANNNSLSSSNKSFRMFYTTGNADQFTKVAKKLVGEDFGDLINSVQHVSL